MSENTKPGAKFDDDGPYDEAYSDSPERVPDDSPECIKFDTVGY